MITSLISSLVMASNAFATTSPLSVPIFLKQGFSTVLEFRESPSKVVLGDAGSFQIEKLETSIAIKPLTPYATTNMLVYFKNEAMRLFILSAAEEAEPTLFRSFKKSVILIPLTAAAPAIKKNFKPQVIETGLSLIQVSADQKKDYVTVDFWVSSGSGKLIPDWELVRLKTGADTAKPSKIWSERREVQSGTRIKARAIFARPNIRMTSAQLVLPLVGKAKGLTLKVGGNL